MKRIKKIVFIILTIITVLVLGSFVFFSYVSNQRAASPEAVASLESDSNVIVQTEPWLIFKPLGETPSTGFIFYQGGLVDEAAYAPSAREISQAGYLVVVPQMPFNLAVLNINVARKIITAYPEINHWAIGGHSLGGSMAAAFSDNHRDLIDGLVLWASYPAENNDLSDSNLIVTSIYGTLDGVAPVEDVIASKPYLPANTTWVPIQGGNHAQFGWFGEQRGDNAATISHQDQTAQVVEATISLLEAIKD